jgi:hypothetical protein
MQRQRTERTQRHSHRTTANSRDGEHTGEHLSLREAGLHEKSRLSWK